MKNTPKPLSIAIQSVVRNKLTLVAAGALLLPLASFAQTPPPPPPSDEIAEEVIVTGVRQAIEKSLNTKKKSNIIMESVTAEDIGKFPDQTVSDAMQRITGIQIEKDATGQSSGFQIRGISQNRVEINGRTSMGASDSTGEGRTTDLSAVPAELIGSLDVYKSMSADLIEGSLGATVNLKTAKPFQLKNKTVVSVKGKYGDNIDENYGNFSLTKSFLWNDLEIGKFGTSINIAYQDDKTSSDKMQLANWGDKCRFYAYTSTGKGAIKTPAKPETTVVKVDPVTKAVTTTVSPATVDILYKPGELYNANGNPENSCAKIQADHQDEPGKYATVYAPDGVNFLQTDEDREKFAGQFAAQWAPTDDLEFLFEAEYFKKDTTERRNTLRINLLADGYQLTPLKSKLFTQIAPDGSTIAAPQSVYEAWSNIEVGPSVNIYKNGLVNSQVNPILGFTTTGAGINNSVLQGFLVETDNYAVSLGTKWHASDDLLLTADLSTAKAEINRHFFQSQINRYSIATPNNASTAKDQLTQVTNAPGAALRSTGSLAVVDLRDSRFPGFEWGEGAVDPTDARYFHFNAFSDDGWVQENGDTSLRVDGTYDFSMPVLSSVQFGVRVTEATANRRERFFFTCNRNFNAPLANLKIGEIDPSFNSLTDRPCENPATSSVYGALSTTPNAFAVIDGIWDQVGQMHPQGGYIQIDPDFRTDHFEDWKKLAGFYETSTRSRATVNPSGGYSVNPNDTYELTENTYAAYVKANFEGELGIFEYRGNAGIRAVKTVDKSRNLGGENAQIKVIQPAGEPTIIRSSIEKDYTNILPSANIAFVYEDNTILRYAVAGVMARPDFADAKIVGNFNRFTGCQNFDETEIYAQNNIKNLERFVKTADGRFVSLQERKDATGNGNDGKACEGIRSKGENSIGNPNLNPYEAINHDLSFEYYWGEGNAASVTLFYKDVKADLIKELKVISLPSSVASTIDSNVAPSLTDEYWYVTQVTNGSPSERNGIELAYTQFADFMPEEWMQGLGWSLNYTLSKGTRSPAIWLDPNINEKTVVPSSFPGAVLFDINSLRPNTDLSENSYNITLFYEKYGFQTRFAYNYRDEAFKGGGAGNEFIDKQRSLDYSATYQINKMFQVSFNVNNILRDGQHRYFDSPSITDESSYGDRVYTLGLTARFN